MQLQQRRIRFLQLPQLPRPEAGAALAAALVILPVAVIIGVHIRSGLGTAADVVIGLLVALIATAVVTVLSYVGIGLFRRLPPVRIAIWLGALFGLAAVIPFASGLGIHSMLLALLIAVPLLTAATVLGGAMNAGVRRGFRQPGVIVRLIAAAALCVGVIFWIVNPGAGSTVAALTADTNVPQRSGLRDPGLPGPYAVASLHYGSGLDRQRPAYGKDVDLATASVDGTAFLEKWDGLGGRLRTWYWGFGPDALPLNAQVWYPDGAGPFPLVLIVHGNHRMMAYSDPGYAYLGEHLASQGYIAASVDQNFLNSSIYGGLGNENAARGWHLLQHLVQWRAWNDEPGHLFAGKVDLDRIALIGHSRGGEAGVLAAAFNELPHYPGDASVAFDFGFAIRSLVAITPVDGQLLPGGRPAPISGVNYLLITGLHDADVGDLSGGRAYERADVPVGADTIKAAVHVYGANHGQFNTEWGNKDLPLPYHWLLNKRPLLTAEEQQRVANVYVSAFLGATLRDDPAYVPLLRDHRFGADWLPETLYVSSYRDGTHQTIASFDEDLDVTTTTLPGGRITGSGLEMWREQEIPAAYGDKTHFGAYLEWADAAPEEAPAFTITMPGDFPDHLDTVPGPALMLALADGRTTATDAPVDFTVRLMLRDGTVAEQPLSQFGRLQTLPIAKRTKLGPLENALFAKPQLIQRFELPLSRFLADPDAAFSDLQSIAFVFDVTKTGAVYVDEIAVVASDGRGGREWHGDGATSR